MRVPTSGSEMLEILDGFLCTSPDAANVWDVLTALRSYDEGGDENLKASTTCRIRAVALPRATSMLADSWPLNTPPFISRYVPYAPRVLPEPANEEELRLTSSHFRGHYYAAEEALRRLGKEIEASKLS